MAAAASTSGPRPLPGLYEFIRLHVAAMNAVVLAAGTVVAALDFLAPSLSVLPQVIYTGTAALAALMLFGACAPRFVGRLLSAMGFARVSTSAAPLWRRPGWQCAVAILSVVTIVGFASVAKASQGGLIASRFPSARNLQESMLSLRQGMADISTGVEQANRKLDKVALFVDPDVAADRCGDLECAVQGGASAGAIRRLLQKGAKVPGSPISDGALLTMAVFSRAPDRFETIDVLVQHGIDRDLLFLPIVTSRGSLTGPAVRWAREVEEVSGLARPRIKLPSHIRDPDVRAWMDVMGCFMRSSGGVSMIELAAILGDGDLYAHLAAFGSQLPARPLACAAIDERNKAGHARLVIEPTSGKVMGVNNG